MSWDKNTPGKFKLKVKVEKSLSEATMSPGGMKSKL